MWDYKRAVAATFTWLYKHHKKTSTELPVDFQINNFQNTNITSMQITCMPLLNLSEKKRIS